MKVFVVGNAHLYKDVNGDYYSPSIYSYDFLKRYLNVFETVKFAGKVRSSEGVDLAACNKVNGPNVEIAELPWFQGIKQMIKKFGEIKKVFRDACGDCDCFIFRIAQLESFVAYKYGRIKNKPFAVEIVNDPETFIDMPSIMKKYSVHMVKKMAREANGAAYVTEEYLQRKYPTATKNDRKHKFQAYYSSIDLSKNDLFDTPVAYSSEKPFRIIHVSNAINSDIKGHTTLIRAFELISKGHENSELVFIGDGSKLNDYKQMVISAGLRDKVKFLGRLSSKSSILNELRASNLMILPTKMEGLPRTIIEAMAVGLPCLSTPVAGIPELLDGEYLFSPNDYIGFANKTLELIKDPDQLNSMGQRNLLKASEYTSDELEPRRTHFYEELKRSAEAIENQ